MHRPRRLLRLSLCFCLSLLLCFWPVPEQVLQVHPVRAAESGTQATAGQQVQLGVDRYQAGDYLGAIAPWQTALEQYRNSGDTANRVVVLENLALTSQQLGQNSDAVNYWEAAIALYPTLDNPQKLGRALTEQAQAYSRLGQHRRALTLLCGAPSSPADVFQAEQCVPGSALQIAIQQEDAPGEVAALASLGEAYRLTGDYQPALAALTLAQAQLAALDNPNFEIALLRSVGNLEIGQANANYRRVAALERLGDTNEGDSFRQLAQQQDAQALASFESALTLAESRGTAAQQLRLLLDQIPLHRRLGDPDRAAQRWQEGRSRLQQVPASQEKAFAALALATLSDPNALATLSSPDQSQPTPALGRHCPSHRAEAEGLLQEGLAIARSINDRRAESFALGQLGFLEECNGNFTIALELTQNARWAADQDRAAQDSLYLWDWQNGRILQAQGEDEAAAVAYQQAIAHLEEIRSDILTANQDLQFDFRDTVEPIYRKLAALNLEQIPTSEVLSKSNEQFQTIDTTLATVDSLKLSELQNYFGSDCVIAPVAQSVRQVQTANADTAIVNTLTFPNRTAVIYSFPNQDTQVEWIEISEAELRQQTIEFRQELESYFDDQDFEPQVGEPLYRMLIQPFEPRLAQSDISTLVFVNDGILRSVPMAALYDGNQFLVERYAIATTPSLQLTDPQPLERSGLKVLALGVAEASQVGDQRFEELPFVIDELEALSQRLPATKLLNDAFSLESLTEAFTQSRYPIVHMATHGKFGADPQENFLVTGGNQKITIGDLDRLIRKVAPTTEPIELLALTACETAIGDDRAALGLAGVAIRAGARSAIASLWAINDESTAQVMDRFYEQLTDPSVSKARALQSAQVASIQQGGEAAHPARWAPYILIGNWL